jgi:anti-anti-sigma factor
VDFAARPEAGDGALLVLSGELDLAAGPVLESAAGPIVESHGRLALDVAGLTLLDSAGIASLVRLHQRLDSGGAALEIRNANKRIHHLLVITGLDHVFDIRDDGRP